MKGSLKLSLAVALALAGSEALALGLGMIQVRSGLNEPLVAEIPVTGGPDETSSLSVALAAAADFERVGLSRSRVQVPLEFTVAAGAKGAVIKVTSKEPVRDPFLDFLIEVNWAKGKLLREYTVLLDPPTMAPAIKGSRASTAPVKETATTAAPSQPLPAAKPGRTPRPTKPPVEATAAAPSTPPPAVEKPAPAAASAAAGEYGPVAAGETLWEVAAATRPDDNVTLNQVMLALHRNNPSAFFKDNINSLKRGAILRVPSVEEIKAVGNAAAAAVEVRSQNDAARSGAAPTLVADSAASSSAPTAAPASKAAQPDRLALVPPKSNKDAKPTAESAGSGTSASGDVTTRAELARTKEALASRDQETNELKSRVRELEEIKNKNDKLITLKDSELADLQRKLRELQEKSGKPATATPPVATPPAATAATPPATSATTPPATKPGEPVKPGEFSKEEIWGAATGDKAPAASTTPPATGTTPPAASTTPPPATGTTPPATTSTLPPATATPSTTTPPATTPPAATTTTPPAATTTPATTPLPAATPPKPAASTATPAKTPAPAKVQPLSESEPWWQKTWVLAVGGLALLAVVALALMNLLRRPKATPAAEAAAGESAFSGGYDEEHGLLDRLAQYPDDTSAHLELTSLYYAQGQTDKFEDAAQAMYAHISDTSMPEWQQVRAMGRELAPHNPLFADEPSYHQPAPAAHSYGNEPEPMRFDGFDDVAGFGKTPAAQLPEEDSFDFDLADRSATTQTIPAPIPTPAAPARDEFSLDLPPMDFDTRISQPSLTPPPSFGSPPPAAAPSRIEDDLMATDDAIGTKLDLAKAYLDMGDPDGAKSMLEEVIIEGSDKQKAEARKLLGEIR